MQFGVSKFPPEINLRDSGTSNHKLLVELLKSASKLGVRVHLASYNLIYVFNDENILSACPDFDLAVEIGIDFANSDFRCF
jgi:hypothetical protein